MQPLAWWHFCSWPQWTFQIWWVICDLLATSYYLDEPSRSVIQMEFCTQMDRNVKQHWLGCGACRAALWYLAAVRSRAPDAHVLFWLSRSTIGVILFAQQRVLRRPSLHPNPTQLCGQTSGEGRQWNHVFQHKAVCTTSWKPLSQWGYRYGGSQQMGLHVVPDQPAWWMKASLVWL